MMTVKNFIDGFKTNHIMNTQIKPNAVSEYIKEVLEVKDYISLVEKQSIAQIVLESCAHMNEGVVSVDSVQKYIIFTITVLSTYTNLEFEGNEADLDAYDMLCSYEVGDGTLLDAIVETFKKEYSRCNDILNMMTADLLAENNIEKQIGKFLSSVTTKIDNLGDTLKKFNKDIGQLDINKITDKSQQTFSKEFDKFQKTSNN